MIIPNTIKHSIRPKFQVTGKVKSFQDEEVCWNDEYDNPKPGCLARPVPGTSVSGNTLYAGERIINGIDADIMAHPWSVCLDIGGLTCGGSIISTNIG